MNTTEAAPKTKMLNELAILQSKFSPEELQLLGSMLLLAEPEEAEVAGHMMDGQMTYDLAMMHHKDLLREAELSRRATEMTQGKQPFWPRFTFTFGKFLVSAGRNMMGRPNWSRGSHSAAD